MKILNIEDNCISYQIERELREYVSRNIYEISKNLSKEYNELKKIEEIEKSKQQELLYLEKKLKELKTDGLEMEKKVYELKSKHYTKEIKELRTQIRGVLSQ